MKNHIKPIAATAIGITILVSAAPAFAGGLFGNGGLIRGTVGRIMQPVQERVFTPALRTVVVGAGTVAGCYYGGPVGCAAGATAGNGINNLAAGRR